jgi:prepilin-type N-terminal cleavage/methylation domain-containing protein
MKIHRSWQTGFTLIEVMITSAVLGVLVAIAVPNMVRARENAYSGALVANLRTASGAFFQYYAAHGAFPPGAAAGTLPAGMSDYLGNFSWAAETSIGGQWAWDRDVNGYKAGVAIVAPTVSLARLQNIDWKIDDGNLATGQFRSRPGGYVLVMDE